MYIFYFKTFNIITYFVVYGNQPPSFIHDLDKSVFMENIPVGSVVGTLEGIDPEGATVRYGISGTDKFQVNSQTGEVTLVKPLDYEVYPLF